MGRRETVFEVSADDYHEDLNGICLGCGEVQYGGCEPDAERYRCESCGVNEVYGLQQALLMGRVNVQGE